MFFADDLTSRALFIPETHIPVKVSRVTRTPFIHSLQTIHYLKDWIIREQAENSYEDRLSVSWCCTGEIAL